MLSTRSHVSEPSHVGRGNFVEQLNPQNVFPARAGVSPIVRWVGGKRWLVPTVAPTIHAYLATTRGRYIEPFLGGGAIALDLGLPGMILGDACESLITMYQQIARHARGVSWSLQTMIDAGVDKETYLRVRANEPRSHAQRAARFIYLNKLGFNGLYRENKHGQFNVPYGRTSTGKPPGFPSVDAFLDIARALRQADVRFADFHVTIARAKKGDVIYADPPYDHTFENYVAGGFDIEDQRTLADALRAAHERGAKVLASNSDTTLIRELYWWAKVTAIEERHSVAANSDKRGARGAVLITSDGNFLR